MSESQEQSDRVPSAVTGRHSHRRRARSRAGESPGALSDGTLEQRLARIISAIIGVGLIVGQLGVAYFVMPNQLLRASLMVIGIIGMAVLVVWLDRMRSKKRNPKPRWMRGIVIAGFLCFSVVLGALLVLNMSANPIEGSEFSAVDGSPGTYSSSSSAFDAKTFQLKLLALHIMATIAGMALLTHASGSAKRRRNDSSRPRSSPLTPT